METSIVSTKSTYLMPIQPVRSAGVLQGLTGILALIRRAMAPARKISRAGELGRRKKGCAVLLLCAATAVASPAQTFTTLYSFAASDGHDPQDALVQGFDGDFYGTTYYGGAHNFGTVFKVTPTGTLTTLYSFCTQTGCTDGEYPGSNLVQGTDGNFYGTTDFGGARNGGEVFKITPAGALTVLYSFCAEANCTDGQGPYTGLIQATDGNFYGTTHSGGSYFDGTVFKITTGGTLTKLYSFCQLTGCPDGRTPTAGLVQATDGNLYGTTSLNGANGYGTLFKITTAGVFTTLYNFCTETGCTDGKYPVGLIQATDGSLYGTAGGGTYNQGTVFKVTLAGALTTLYSFCPQTGCSDGSDPRAGVVQGTDGNFYGTTDTGGAHLEGTVFKITPAGALTTLYNFCAQAGCPDGFVLYAGLVQGTDGTFYATTYKGGAHGDGTVFNLALGIKAFVETRPVSGKVGARVIILGTNLTGATGVSFNGTAATFTVVSGSEIKTTVPAGATTGKVKVATSGGTFSSNVAFRVKP
jgi:uncharacterized repeat protein (TIGR03803 family)